MKIPPDNHYNEYSLYRQA